MLNFHPKPARADVLCPKKSYLRLGDRSISRLKIIKLPIERACWQYFSLEKGLNFRCDCPFGKLWSGKSRENRGTCKWKAADVEYRLRNAHGSPFRRKLGLIRIQMMWFPTDVINYHDVMEKQRCRSLDVMVSFHRILVWLLIKRVLSWVTALSRHCAWHLID